MRGQNVAFVIRHSSLLALGKATGTIVLHQGKAEIKSRQ
jgi:hypothetical protein